MKLSSDVIKTNLVWYVVHLVSIFLLSTILLTFVVQFFYVKYHLCYFSNRTVC